MADTTIPVWPSSETIKHWESISKKELNTAFDGIENSPWEDTGNNPLNVSFGDAIQMASALRQGSTTTGTLSYPIDIDENQDHLEINRHKYKRPGKEQGITNSINESGPNGRGILGSLISTIILPMPKVSDSNGAQWGKSELNVFGVGMTRLAGMALSLGKQGGEDETKGRSDFQSIGNAKQAEEWFAGQKGGNWKSLGEELRGSALAGGSIVAAQAMSALGQQVTADQVLARSRGSILNPNAELLFSGPVLREFSFTFLLLARSRREGDSIRKIIRTLKEGAAPKYANVGILNNPDVFQLEYKRGRSKLATANKFLPMGLRTVEVDYAPDGFWTAYEDSQPVACRMGLSFAEVRPIYEVDQKRSSGNSVGL